MLKQPERESRNVNDLFYEMEGRQIQKMNKVLARVELTKAEEKTLIWLAGWEESTVDHLLSVIEKAARIRAEKKGGYAHMQKVMYELQRQSIEIKRTQQDISSLKKQLSELRGLFKGKERKSLEGRIELLEDLEKRLHKSLEQIVKREGYPNVQAFQKVYNKAEELIIEYNEELRVWKNQTEQKKEKPLEQPKKASVLEKLHRYQQEGRQQPKRSVKKKSMDRER